MIRYRLSYGRIEKRNVTRETDKSIWYDEPPWYGSDRSPRNTMCRKDAGGVEWFDTFEEAKNVHVQNKMKKLEAAKREVDRARSELETAKQIIGKTENETK